MAPIRLGAFLNEAASFSLMDLPLTSVYMFMSPIDADGCCLSCVLQMWWSRRRCCAPAVWWVESTPLPSGATASWQHWGVFSGRGNGGKRKTRSWSRALQVRQAGLCFPFYLNLVYYWKHGWVDNTNELAKMCLRKYFECWVM